MQNQGLRSINHFGRDLATTVRWQTVHKVLGAELLHQILIHLIRSKVVHHLIAITLLSHREPSVGINSIALLQLIEIVMKCYFSTGRCTEIRAHTEDVARKKALEAA